MDSKELLKSISNAFFSSQDDRVIYFSLSGGLIANFVNIVDDDVALIDLAKIKSPLSPFIDILKNLKVSEAQIKKYVYGLHYSFFKSYLLEDQIGERSEPLLPEELDYEKLRIREAVIRLIGECFEGKLVILNAHLMSEDSLKILSHLEKNLSKGKLVVCFNSVEVEDYSDVVRNFVNSVVNSSNYYSINSVDTKEVFSSEYIEDEDDIDITETVKILKTLRMFLDLNQAYTFMKSLDSSGLLNDYELSELRELNYEMGVIAFYSRDTDYANFCFNKVIESKEEDDELTCYTLYMMARVESAKNMNSVALKHINRGLVSARGLETSKVYALLVMMDYIITERSDSEYSTTKYFNAIDLLAKSGYVNNKIHTTLNIPYGIMYNKELREEMLRQVEISKDEAEKIDNKFVLSTACHWMGIIMTHEGRKEEALVWYEKCLSLRKEIGDIDSITKILNGLAYGNFLDSRYKNAFNQINGVVEYLIDNRDYPEVVITLNNLGRICFYAKNYEYAAKIYRSILNLFKIFDISDLAGNSFLPEYNDIAIYVAAIDLFKNEINRAKMNLYNVMNNGKKIGVVEKYMISFLNACLELENGAKKKALKIMDDCVLDFQQKKINQDHQIVFMLYEFAILLKKYGHADDSKEYYSQGLRIAKAKDLVHYTLGKESPTLQDYIDQSVEFGDLNISLRLLEEKAEKEKLLNRIHKRLRDSQFLNKLVSTSVDTLSDLTYANNTVQSIFDYTMADAVFLGERNTEGDWNCVSSVVREQHLNSPADIVWWKYSKDRGVVNTYNVDEERIAIFMNLSKFNFVGGIIIYLQKKNELNIEEKNILSVAASNIQAQLIMLKQNEYLSQISVTDQLSSLNNRRSLEDHINVESELIRRYEKKKNLHMKEAISFMDLDNFKYYNDTFGHEAGDFLISSFAKLLKKIYRKVDFVARFGGDEFVVMLPNTSSEEAVRAAERLKIGLQEEQNFIPALEKMLGKEVEIPENKILNFSMGICSNIDCEDSCDLEKVMLRADQALYYSKEHKKGSVTVWDDVKDQLEEKQ